MMNDDELLDSMINLYKASPISGEYENLREMVQSFFKQNPGHDLFKANDYLTVYNILRSHGLQGDTSKEASRCFVSELTDYIMGEKNG